MKNEQLLINVEQCQINTASVNIESIKINNKQMTLAVFRQLIRDDNITGPIWGQVNYHPDKCSDESGENKHIHLVWQKENTLRRATKYERDFVKDYMYLMPDNIAKGLFASAILERDTDKNQSIYDSAIARINDYHDIGSDYEFITEHYGQSSNLAYYYKGIYSKSSLSYQFYHSAIIKRDLVEYIVSLENNHDDIDVIELISMMQDCHKPRPKLGRMYGFGITNESEYNRAISNYILRTKNKINLDDLFGKYNIKYWKRMMIEEKNKRYNDFTINVDLYHSYKESKQLFIAL